MALTLQVCPGCLQTQPYQRLLWRLAPVRVCLEHACLLQTQCHRCGAPLAVVGRAARHLRCMSCGTDLRTLPVVAAPDDLLAAQSRLQAALQFLLDPDVTLVRHPEPQEDGPAAEDLPQAVGLKFRYLRTQAGHSVAEIGRRLGVGDGLIGQLELGQRVPLLLYLTYLEAFSLSWPDFAALEVPPAFRATACRSCLTGACVSVPTRLARVTSRRWMSPPVSAPLCWRICPTARWYASVAKPAGAATPVPTMGNW